MEPIPALAVLASLFSANAYSGAIPAILVNTPGSGSSTVTCWDGYPMAKRGEAGKALGMATVASGIGGIFSVIVFVLAAPALSRLAYEFGPPEYFAMYIFGLSMLASIGASSPVKNLVAGAFGILLATVGIDIMTSTERFTFGLPELTSGIQFVPVLVGLFAISELLEQSERLNQTVNVALKSDDMIQALRKLGSSPLGGTPQDFRKLLADESPKWLAVLKTSGMKFE